MTKNNIQCIIHTKYIYWDWCICVKFISPSHQRGFGLLGTSPLKNIQTFSCPAPPRPPSPPSLCTQSSLSVTCLESAMGCKPEDHFHVLVSVKVTCHGKIASGIVFCWLWKLLALRNLYSVQLDLSPVHLKNLREVSEKVFIPTELYWVCHCAFCVCNERGGLTDSFNSNIPINKHFNQ